MSLFSFYLRYLQVTMWIWKSITESNTERRSCCLHNQLDLCLGELASRDTNKELEERQEIQCYIAETAIEPQIDTDVESFLLVFLFVFVNCFVPRDHWQITFVMLNKFSLLLKTSHHLFLIDNIKFGRIPRKIKWKIYASFTLYFKS